MENKILAAFDEKILSENGEHSLATPVRYHGLDENVMGASEVKDLIREVWDAAMKEYDRMIESGEIKPQL